MLVPESVAGRPPGARVRVVRLGDLHPPEPLLGAAEGVVVATGRARPRSRRSGCPGRVAMP
ncbi:hypothetical protein ACFSTC_38230 [Nonomuraea ferruginea]